MVVDINVPRELRDSVKDVLGSRKARTMRMVQAGIKQDRLDTRTLILTDHRVLIFTTKVPVKIEHNIHFLEMTALESPVQNQLFVSTDQKRVCITTMDKGEVDELLLQIGQSLHKTFPAKNLQSIVPSFVVKDTPRQLALLDRLHDVTRGAGGGGGGEQESACGGFGTAYRCVCDLYNSPCQEDVVWDVDTIYQSQDTRTLNLADFDHLDGKHLIPIIAALEHNAYFTGLNINNIKLSPEAFNEVLRVVKSNTVLEELHLANIGAKADFAQRLTTALSSNDGAQLKVLDLSNNLLDDKGISALCSVPRLSRALTGLHLRTVGMTGRGISKLCEAMASNLYMPTTLTTLDFSGNTAKGEELTMLNKFLSTPNAVTHLTLSGTDCTLDTMCAAWLRGCTTHLRHLDVSGCVFSQKKPRDVTVPNAWKQFFSSSLTLESVSLADCKGLPSEAIKTLLLGLSSNPQSLSVSVDLSGCNLGQPGAVILEMCIPGMANVASLDISNNSLDHGLEGLMSRMGLNRCIRKLNIGRNFAGIKARNLTQVLNAIVLLMQDEVTTVESLSLADSKLKAEITILINALGSNSSLQEIDISGNLMGDIGARMLGKALQINTKLHSIHWDNNATSPQGFHDIAAALQKNCTVKQMPTPINDATAAYKINPEKTQAALQTIEKLLQRNHSPRKFSPEQAFRLQQGFLLSSSQQMVDKLMVQINSLLASPSSSSTLAPGDVSAARQLLQDAERSRNILPAFQQLTTANTDMAPLNHTLKQSAASLHAVIQQCMAKNRSSMLQCAGSQCPTVMKDKTFRSELETASEEKSFVSANFTDALLMEQLGTDITNKISEVNLSVAAYMSDKITDGVLESLDKSYKHLSKQKGESGLDREARHSILRTKSNESLEESPKLSKKKKTLYNRRLRPQSTINNDAMTGDADDQSDNRSEDSLDTTDLTDLTDASTVDTLDSRESTPSSELRDRPTTTKSAPITPASTELDEALGPLADATSAPRLQHLAKQRPKRAKTRAASRAVVSHGDLQLEDSGMGSVTEDVDEFFENKMPPPQSPSSAMPPSAALSRKEAVNGAETHDDHHSKKKLPKSLTDKPASLAANFSNLFRRKSPSPKSPEAPQLKTPDDGPTRRSPDGENSAIAEEAEVVEEAPEPDRPSPSGIRLPPGARGMPGMGGAVPMPGMGGGSSLMSELKKKQRQSAMPAGGDNDKPEPTPSQPSRPPPSTGGQLTQHKVVPAYGGHRPPSLYPRGQRDSTVAGSSDNLAAPKPIPAQRSVSPNDASGDKPNKPPPPLKPRPVLKPRPKPPTTPAPAPTTTTAPADPIRRLSKPNAAPGNRSSDPEDRPDGGGGGSDGGDSRESSPTSASIKKRGSVRERARFLDNNNKPDGSSNGGGSGAPPASAPPTDGAVLRSRTLPRDDKNGGDKNNSNNNSGAGNPRSRSMLGDVATSERLSKMMLASSSASSSSSVVPPPVPTSPPPPPPHNLSDSGGSSSENGGESASDRDSVDIVYL